jgi:hypothetical protein
MLVVKFFKVTKVLFINSNYLLKYMKLENNCSFTKLECIFIYFLFIFIIFWRLYICKQLFGIVVSYKKIALHKFFLNDICGTAKLEYTFNYE